MLANNEIPLNLIQLGKMLKILLPTADETKPNADSKDRLYDDLSREPWVLHNPHPNSPLLGIAAKTKRSIVITYWQTGKKTSKNQESTQQHLGSLVKESFPNPHTRLLSSHCTKG